MRRSKPAPQNEFFPGFTDIAEIGIGSLATVYRAREVGTNRQVALKLLNVRDASPRALESFERESIALGAVSSHPNIVTLYRSFRAADERPVLVLELCHGSVGDRMRGGAGLPVAEVVALGIKIAGALETAHRAEILHRDVKPQNILMTEFGEPALADFGVAMLQSSTQTTAGLFDFTTLHAAPELLEGGETSAATDVYELASSLYQLIAGRAAFRAYDGESPASVILRILRDPVQPLVNTQAPASLSDLLVYAMSKDKASRPPTAVEFAAELATIEVEQQWPRTQFLIRDAGGGTTGLPTITRMPEPGRRGSSAPAPFVAPAASAPPQPLPPPTGRPLGGPAPVPAAAPVPAPAGPQPEVAPTPVDDGWSTPTVVTGHAPEDEESPASTEILPAARVDPRPTNERVLVERQVIERIVFDPAPAVQNGWSDVSIVRAHPDDEPPASDDPAPSQGPVVDPVVDQPEPLDVWAPPPPPEVLDAEVPRPHTPETRLVPLADPELLLGPGAGDPEAERLEAERLEAERVAAERADAERLAAERLEAERAAAERVEAERVAAERVEADRLAAERLEAERAAAERVEAELVEAERVAAERAEAERAETERAETERISAERLAAERLEADRLAAERAEAERVEAERLAAERVEAERLAAEQSRDQTPEIEPKPPVPSPPVSAGSPLVEVEPPGDQAPDVEPESPVHPPPVSAWSPSVEVEQRGDQAPDVVPESPVPTPPVSAWSTPVVAEPVAERAPSAPPEDDLASIWGSVEEPATLPETVAPPPPPDPSTRVSDAPGGDGPSDLPVQPDEPENPLPFVPWRGAIAEPNPFDTGEHRVDPAVVNAHDGPPAQYPIPPAGVLDESAPVESGSGTVPTWAFRNATQAPAGPAAYGDLALDPMSLRSKVTLRAGASSLVVDDSGLSVRMRMRRSSIAWADVLGFEPRFDEGGRDGSLVVLTRSGPVELGATRRRAGDVRYVHALLDAYRQRAAILGRQ